MQAITFQRKITKAASRIWHREAIQKLVPTKLYLKIEYKNFVGKKLNLKNPTTYNEKVQWLKLYNKVPQKIPLTDKYAVRSYIAEKIGEQYLIPLLGVYDNFEQIDFAVLPNEFVLKPTHTSGDIFICKDKSTINHAELKKLVSSWMKKNYFYVHREWPYKFIKPRIVCEQYMVDESGIELKDYKFFCFQGEPKSMMYISGRGVDTRLDFFDMSFQRIPVMRDYKNHPYLLKRPAGFDEMVELAKVLAKDFLHVRVDFYNIRGKIYFGELTFYPSAGLRPFEPEHYDKEFGDWLVLPIEGAKAE